MKLKNKVTNPKTYTFFKYLFTLSNLFSFTIPLISFLFAIDKFTSEKIVVLYKVQIILLTLNFIFMGIFIFFRFYIHMSGSYKYDKRDFILNSIWISITVIGLLIVTILFFIESNIPNHSFKILWYVLYPLLIIILISASVLESQSRILEQIHISKEFDKHNKALDGVEVKNEKVKLTNKSTKKDTKIKSKEFEKKDNPFED